MGELGKCLFVVTWLIFAWAFHVQAQVEEDQDACTHTSWWKPDGDELKRILDNHRQWAEEWGRSSYSDAWAERHTYRRAYLCNADLRGAQLNEANLAGAQLNEADLSLAQLKDATLSYTTNLPRIYLIGPSAKSPTRSMSGIFTGE
jgi:hypothetical protein